MHRFFNYSKVFYQRLQTLLLFRQNEFTSGFFIFLTYVITTRHIQSKCTRSSKLEVGYSTF